MSKVQSICFRFQRMWTISSQNTNKIRNKFNHFIVCIDSVLRLRAYRLSVVARRSVVQRLSLPNQVRNQTSQQAKHTRQHTVVNVAIDTFACFCADRYPFVRRGMRFVSDSCSNANHHWKRTTLILSTRFYATANAANAVLNGFCMAYSSTCVLNASADNNNFYEVNDCIVIPANAFNHPQTAHKTRNHFVRIITRRQFYLRFAPSLAIQFISNSMLIKFLPNANTKSHFFRLRLCKWLANFIEHFTWCCPHFFYCCCWMLIEAE